MDILFIAPGFPAEMPYFVRALAEVGARVFGVGNQPVHSLDPIAANALSGYLCTDLWDSGRVIHDVRRWQGHRSWHRVECLWEPGMMLAAELREAFNVWGLTRAQTEPFRDKTVMKRVLDQQGIRTPRHVQAESVAEIRTAADTIGYPLILKPIAGAGSADTYRIDDEQQLRDVIPKIAHVRLVSVEEFIKGQEYTYDTICAGGNILFDNVACYRPNALIGRSEEWISPQTLTLRDMDQPDLIKGRTLGLQVLKALSFQEGFTHMEWFMTPSGEAVFGEIGARPPGGRSVELMNYANDIDVFRGWAQAICIGRFDQKFERIYNAVVVFKRAHGSGRITAIQGLSSLKKEFGAWMVCINLAEIGSPRRDWKQTLISDGYIILRHPDLEQTKMMADQVGKRLQMFAE